jgi:hypothetical protein
MKHKALFVYHVLEYLFSGLEVVPFPVKDLFADRFLLVVMETVEIRVA